jgi:zinc transporter ZupT
MQIMLFLAIITHKWAESFAISIQLNKSTLSSKYAIMLFLSFALMTPLGIGIGWYFGRDVSTHSLIDPILMAVSAGTFLYLGTLHGLERCVMVQRCCNLRDFSFVIIGFLLMAAVAVYV